MSEHPQPPQQEPHQHQHLLDTELCSRLPRLYATEHEPEQLVRAKFFTPWSQWTWYPIEFDGKNLFFGLVDGLEVELGFFLLSELASLRGPGGLKVERDIYFEPTPVATLRAQLERGRADDSARMFGLGPGHGR